MTDRVNGASPDLDRAQRNTARSIQESRPGEPFKGGILLEDIEVTVGTPKRVSHRLGTGPRGFIITHVRTMGQTFLPAMTDGGKGFVVFEVDGTGSVRFDAWIW